MVYAGGRSITPQNRNRSTSPNLLGDMGMNHTVSVSKVSNRSFGNTSYTTVPPSVSQGPGKPSHMEALMNSRRNKNNTVSQDILKRQKVLCSTKNGFLQEKAFEKKTL